MPSDQELPQAVHEERVFIGDLLPIRLYILEDGRRVLEADDVHAAMQEYFGSCKSPQEARQKRDALMREFAAYPELKSVLGPKS